jgi:hypothetical protein
MKNFLQNIILLFVLSSVVLAFEESRSTLLSLVLENEIFSEAEEGEDLEGKELEISNIIQSQNYPLEISFIFFQNFNKNYSTEFFSEVPTSPPNS